MDDTHLQLNIGNADYIFFKFCSSYLYEEVIATPMSQAAFKYCRCELMSVKHIDFNALGILLFLNYAGLIMNVYYVRNGYIGSIEL